MKVDIEDKEQFQHIAEWRQLNIGCHCPSTHTEDKIDTSYCTWNILKLYLKKTSSHTWNSLSIVPILVSPAIFVITSSYNENKKIIKITTHRTGKNLVRLWLDYMMIMILEKTWNSSPFFITQDFERKPWGVMKISFILINYLQTLKGWHHMTGCHTLTKHMNNPFDVHSLKISKLLLSWVTWIIYL